jgi:hypothetical protein
MIFLFNLKNYINNFLILKCLRSKLSVSEFYTISVKTNVVRGAKRVYTKLYTLVNLVLNISITSAGTL